MRHILKSLVKIYQYGVSPLLGPRCRFQPSCSEYAAQAIEKHGSARGTVLACKRFCKCHPLSGKHGYDPVPED